LDYLFNVSAFFILISWSLTNEFSVRGTAIFGYLILLQYGVAIGSPTVFLWACLFILANLVRVILLIKDLIPRDLPKEFQSIKEDLFPNMPAGDFMRLIKLSHKGKATEQRLITGGQNVKYLLLITSGTMYVELNNLTIELTNNHFIGEMSYFNKGIATGTVFVKEPAEYIYWDYDDLYELQRKKSALFMHLINAMGKDIVMKMINKNKVATIDD
jgi:hypothetical protein